MAWRVAFSVMSARLVVFPCTLCTSGSILLQHVSREALTPEGARRVDTSVVADVALIYQALIHVLHLNRTLHCVLPIPLLTDGEGFFRVQAVRYCSAWRECLLFSQAIQNCIKQFFLYRTLLLYDDYSKDTMQYLYRHQILKLR